MRVVLVHGFNVKDGGANTVDKLAPYLITHGITPDTDEADYGYFSLLMVRLRKHSAILRIAKALEHSDAVVTHSNGANYAMKALRLVHKEGIKVVHLSPACNSNTPFPKAVERGWVFFTHSDFWVWLSGFLPFHPWGQMGWRGYTGEDPRIENVDFTDVVNGHSGWFEGQNPEYFAAEIALKLRSE